MLSGDELMRRDMRIGGRLKGSLWYYQKQAYALNLISTWEKRYRNQPALVKILVENARLDRRSPGERVVYDAWLKEHENILPVVISHVRRDALVETTRVVDEAEEQTFIDEIRPALEESEEEGE